MQLDRLPLRAGFRFVHEPLTSAHKGRFVGRGDEIGAFARRLQLSDGGAFLITGYRGVGKTSWTNAVVDAVREAEHAAGHRLLDLRLNLARPMKPAELMHHILRNLHGELVREGLFAKLSADLRGDLETAVRRTSFNMARKSIEGIESVVTAKLPMPGWAAKFGGNVSREDSLTWLGYDDKAAEHDLIRISSTLTRGIETHRSFLGFPYAPRTLQLKILFVFDEMDKLDDGKYIDDLLSCLKNLFTTSGICFLFVGGKDLEDRWLDDLGRGDSIFESVFAHHQYIPCLWSGASSFLDTLLDESTGDGQTALRADFERYLCFQGRGVPRSLLRVLHEHVTGTNGDLHLEFIPQALQRIRTYSDLEETLGQNATRLFPEDEDGLRTGRRDKQRLAVYHLVDWIIHRGKIEFGRTDVGVAAGALSRKLALPPENLPGVIDAILAVLHETEYIRAVNAAEATQGSAVALEPRYALVRERLQGLRTKAAEAAPEPKVVEGYWINKAIGSGSTSTVYLAWDERRSVFAALKVSATARLMRDPVALKMLAGEGVPRLYDYGTTPDGQHWVAMEYIDGVSLRTLMKARQRLPVELVNAIMRRLLEVVRRIHGLGWINLDIKPGNVRLGRDGHLYLVDVGSAVEIDAAGLAHHTDSLMFTPAYAAPELKNKRAFTWDADIYSCGVLAHELQFGTRPQEGQTSPYQAMLDVRASILWQFAPDEDAMLRDTVASLADQADVAEESTQRSVTAPGRPAVSFELPTMTASTQDLPRLEFTAGGTFHILPLTHEITRVGRDPELELTISDPSLSRVHAIIKRAGDAIWVQDQNSANGTLVNGRPISRNAFFTIEDGSVIRLGSIEMTLRVPAAIAAPEVFGAPPHPIPPPL